MNTKIIWIFSYFYIFSKANQCSDLLSAHSTNKTLFNQLLLSTSLQNSNCPARVQPTYLWGQNMTHIHLKFRFSISLDTPSCSNLYNFTKQVTHNSFSLSALCIDSGKVILFRLYVQTWRSINFNFCQWKDQEQTIKVMECLKSPYPYFWKQLHVKEEHRPENMHIWWDIYRRYRGDIGDMISLLELERYEEGEEYRTGYTKKEKVVKYEPEPNFVHRMQYSIVTRTHPMSWPVGSEKLI